MREHGRPITGAEYQRLPHGPAPRRLVPIRERLVANGDAELRREVLVGRVQERLHPRRSADLSRFTESELDTINRVLEQLGERTGTELSELSHQEPAWNLVGEGETIPYETAFLRPGPPGPGPWLTPEGWQSGCLVDHLPAEVARRRSVCHGGVFLRAETAFGNDFEGQLEETPGSPIRIVLTGATPFFPTPLAFYALLADEDTVEIVDLAIDEDWLETLGDDFG